MKHTMPEAPKPARRSDVTVSRNGLDVSLSPEALAAHDTIESVGEDTRRLALHLAERVRSHRVEQYTALARRIMREHLTAVLVVPPALDVADQLARVEGVMDAFEELCR